MEKINEYNYIIGENWQEWNNVNKDQPRNFFIKLYDYQLASIYCMKKIETNPKYINDGVELYTNVGFLANKVGSGKTLTVLGHIEINKNEENSKNKSCLGNGRTFFLINLEDEKFIKTSIIIIPHNLKFQWKNDIEKTMIKYVILDTKKKIEEEITNIVNDKYEAVILSSTMITKFSTYFKDILFERIFIDEYLTISIEDMKLNSKFLWLINYLDINSHNKSSIIRKKDIFNLENLEEKMLSRVIVYTEEDYINKFNIFDISKQTILCKSSLSNNFTYIVDYIEEQEIKDLFCSNNYIKLLKCLDNGNGNEKEQNLVKLYIDYLLSLIETNRNKLNNPHKSLKLRTEDYKQKYFKRLNDEIHCIDDKINSIKNIIKNLENGKCFMNDFRNICNQEVNVLNCCFNLICNKCVDKLYHSNKSNIKCPSCKNFIKNINCSISNYNLPTKTQACIKIINEKLKDKTNKILICSLFENSYEEIKAKLNKYGKDIQELKGSSNIVQKIIQKYNSGEIPILFLNGKYINSGINLEKTTDIILYHYIPKNLNTQILGRALRINRKKNLELSVYYLRYSCEDLDEDYIQNTNYNN